MMMLLLLLFHVIHGAVVELPEYKGSRLSNGPHLSLDEYAFMRATLGAVREVSIECWIYLRDWDDGASIVSRPFFSATGAAADSFPHSMFRLGRFEDREQLEFAVSRLVMEPEGADRELQPRISFARVRTTAVVERRRWTHVAATYSAASGRLSLFMNGELQSAYVATPSGVLLGKRGVPLIVGRTAPALPQRNFFGMIDELRIWSVCRSIDQIARHFNRRSYGDEEHLLLYLNGDSGADVDVTGNCVAKRDKALYGDAYFNETVDAPVEAPFRK
jgi:hypothetical protein